MALRRCLLELGNGVDLHGKNSTKAARRAVFNALHHSSISFPRVFGYETGMMSVEVNIAVPNHETVNINEVLEEIPYGSKSIKVSDGGMEIPGGTDSSDSTIVANAAIIVSLDVED